MSDSENNTVWQSADGIATLVNAAASALVLVNSKGKIEFASQAVENIFGETPDNLLGKHINSLLLPTMRQHHQQYIDEFFKKPFSREMGEGASFPAQHKNGSTVHVSIGLSSVEKDGEQFVLATITLAAKLNEATASLRHSQSSLIRNINQNKRLTHIAEESTDAVMLLDQDNSITWLNRAALNLMGCRQHEIIGESILHYVGKQTTSSQLSLLRDSLITGVTFSGEVVIAKNNDTTVQVDASLQPVFDHDVLQGFYFTAKDVTSRRRLEAQMRENNELLETTARIAKLGFYSLDLVSNQLNWSEEVYNIHDLPKSHNIQVDEAINYYAPEAQPIITKAVENCMETGDSFDLELPFITAKNRKIWVRSVGYAEFNGGKPIKLKGAFQDITSLRQTAIDAEQAAMSKSRFLANMSHELRTPITGVLGVSELLRDTSLDAKQKHYVEVINHSADSLLFLVNQVLDYAKLDSGYQKVNEIRFKLKQFVRDKVYIHQVAAGEKGCKFVIQFDSHVPEQVVGDANIILQVLNNLCANAVKFTQYGEISVVVSVTEFGYLKFTVTDTGVGIDAHNIDTLFDEFQQVDNSFSRVHQGTGLGLTISKQLVDLMHGQIGVTSELGVGSTFWFTAPLTMGEATNHDSADRSLPSTLLLVKDEICASVWHELAHNRRLKIKPCFDVSTLLSSLKADAIWDLVVLVDYSSDIPLQTCIASVKRILNSQQQFLISTDLAPQLPIDAQDTSITIDLHNLAYDNDIHALADWQFEALSLRFKEGQCTSPIALAEKHLLIVEDNNVNQLLFKEMLLDTKAIITFASNGEEALAVIEGASKPFDLVIMDCQMPVMDGFQATEKIRAHAKPEVASLKITAATAHGFDSDIQKCYEVGMDDVLIKPFSKQQLLETIKRNV
ncbi:MAG: ATP-binding protein [Glaciecola sp.]